MFLTEKNYQLFLLGGGGGVGVGGATELKI